MVGCPVSACAGGFKPPRWAHAAASPFTIRRHSFSGARLCSRSQARIQGALPIISCCNHKLISQMLSSTSRYGTVRPSCRRVFLCDINARSFSDAPALQTRSRTAHPRCPGGHLCETASSSETTRRTRSGRASRDIGGRSSGAGVKCTLPQDVVHLAGFDRVSMLPAGECSVASCQRPIRWPA